MIESSDGPAWALELVDVHKTYPGDPPVHALRGVDVRIADRELVGVVGPSGSGKSTLLHVMGTLDRPTSGWVHIGGQEVSALPDRRLSAVRAHLVGFVFQQFFLMPGMTVLDNVATGLLYTGQPTRARRRAAVEALLRVDLGHRLHHVPEHLSGGERQRVAIARALVHRPRIVLADEPTGNLDTANSDALLDLLRELNDAGSTIVVITHDMEVAGALPRRVSFRDGLVEHDTGSPADRPVADTSP